MTALGRISRRLGFDPRAALGLAVLVAGAMVWTLMFTGVLPALLRSPGTTVRADFRTTLGIVANDPVRINGVDVGQVAKVTLDPSARGATLQLDLNGSAGPIYRDATVSILWRTLLGANYAVSIDPGSPTAGSLGSATIPQSHTSSQVELDDITRTLQSGAQQGLRTLIQQLGPAFSDRAAPAATFSTLARVAPAVTAGVGAVRGQQPDVDLENLILQSSRAASALDAPDEGVQRFVQFAAATLQATSASADDIRSTISDAASVLPRADVTLTNLDHTLTLADPLIARLLPAAPSVAPTLAALRPTVSHADTLLREATPLLRTLRPTVSSLATTAQVGNPVLDQLEPALDQVNTQILPHLNELSPESREHYYEMIGPMFAGADGLSSGFDANGSFIRLTGSGGPEVLDTLPCHLQFNPGTSSLLACDTISGAFEQFLNPTQSIFGGSQINSVTHADPQLAAKLFKYVPGAEAGQG
jgi:virulence factor Mce-like protein